MNPLPRRSTALLPLLLLAFAGAGLVLVFGGAGAWSIVAATALAAAGGAAAWQAAAGHRRQLRAIEACLAQHGRFGAALAPVWSGHIETSRAQMETAVASLSERFSGIVHRLEQTVATAGASTGVSGDGGLMHMFSRSEQALGSVVASLQQAMDSKAEMLGQVEQLNRFIDELSRMATDVAKIAQQTNLLAINAAIEAAHAGETGRGFAVLAQEVRKLSAMSGDTGRDIAQKVELINQAIVAARQSAQAAAEREAHTVAQSREAIGGVLDGFRGVTDALVASSEQLQRESLGIRSEVSEALVQLQFQDRVSQIMSHVKANIERLPEVMGRPAQCYEQQRVLQPPEPGELLEALQGSYAMAEERQLHHGRADSAAAAPRPAEEVTFF